MPYKKIDLIVEAFAKMPERKLVVIGDGPEMRKIREKATANVEIMGYQPFAVLQDKMRRASAFVFAAEEDFGISVVEAQACGTPVIAYGKGGALETVLDESQSTHRSVLRRAEHRRRSSRPSRISNLVRRQFSAAACRANAERFSTGHFRERCAPISSKSRRSSRSHHGGHVVGRGAVTRPAGQKAENHAAADAMSVLAVDQSGVMGGAELSLLEVMKNMRGDNQAVLIR